MGRKGNRDRGGGAPPAAWESERTLAAAEQEAAEPAEESGPSADTACICGHRELLLQAFLRVVDGVMHPEPLEVETLTCPECEREFEAIQGEGGRILRGDFLSQSDGDE